MTSVTMATDVFSNQGINLFIPEYSGPSSKMW